MSIKAQDKIITQCSSWKEFVAFQDIQLDTTGKGDLFERLVQLYLLSAPQFTSKLSNVWWPRFEKLPKGLAEHLNLSFPENGIDLIAKTIDGEYWPVQAKYESDTTGAKQKRNLTSFSTAAFNYGENMHLGLVAHTKAKPIRKRKLLESEKKGNKITELGLSYWLELDEDDWAAIKQQASGKTYRPKPRTKKDHQETAIKKAKEHFIDSEADRGRLIMPCASGKSLTAYWIARQLNAKSIIVAVPSLSLIKQTVKEWTREYTADKSEPDWICICSDKSVGKLDDENDDFVKDIYDLGLPVTTDRDTILAFLKKDSKSPKIIFTTYMSSPILSEVAKDANYTIDFCIFDEAHKTAGRASKRSTALLKEENINVKKRLFMTATERILSGSGKSEKAYSMNDKSVYGEPFYTLSFKDAIAQKIVCDYKIITMAVSKPEIDKLIGEHKFVINEDGGQEILNAASLAAGIALEKVIQTYGAKHAISFHRSIASAKHFNSQQALLSALGVVSSDTEYSHISSKLSTGERSQVMSDFVAADKSVMTNAKCLTEGVDIPAIDCVLFASPKQSVVDIVQAAGRAMRPDNDNGKEFGYILIPIVVPDGMEFEDFASTTEFKVVAKQLAALSSQDERIAEYFRLIDKGEKPTGNPLEIVGDVPVGMNINFNDFASAVETKLWDKIAKINWRPFEECCELVQKHKFKDVREYRRWQSSIRPADIPSHPHIVYKHVGWISWGDFLGTYKVDNRNRKWRPFNEAREFVRKLEIKNQGQLAIWAKSGLRPTGIPYSPDIVYKDEGWINLGDWLGTGSVATRHLIWRPFNEARKFAHTLKLQNQQEWQEWKKTDARPADIPKNPHKAYEKEGWIGLGDWLGTGKVRSGPIIWRPFEEARKFVRSLKLQSETKWQEWAKTDGRPTDIPSLPHTVYQDEGWINFRDWLGAGNVKSGTIIWRRFEEAREFACSLKFQNKEEWKEWSRAGLKPADIPDEPGSYYKEVGWLGWGDWLGTDNITPGKITWRSFKEAREFAHSLKLQSVKEWREWSKTDLRPTAIPADPGKVYKDVGWEGMGDWLGTGNVNPRTITWRPFEEAREFAHSLKLQSGREWREWSKTDLRPTAIPADPRRTYKDVGWEGMGDWLGTGNVQPGTIIWRPFEEAREFVRRLELKGQLEWTAWAKSSLRPRDIPSAPHLAYKEDGWLDLRDWLGINSS